MACNCSKKRTAATAAASMQPAGTYRVIASDGRKVYESTNEDAANMVAAKFSGSTVLAPGQSA